MLNNYMICIQSHRLYNTGTNRTDPSVRITDVRITEVRIVCFVHYIFGILTKEKTLYQRVLHEEIFDSNKLDIKTRSGSTLLPPHCIVGHPHWCCYSSNRTLLPSSQSLLSRAAYAFRVAWSERVISDTSLKCIDQRGLRRRRTWTRQDLFHISVCFKSGRIFVEYC